MVKKSQVKKEEGGDMKRRREEKEDGDGNLGGVVEDRTQLITVSL